MSQDKDNILKPLNKTEQYIKEYCEQCPEWAYRDPTDPNWRCDPDMPCPINNYIKLLNGTGSWYNMREKVKGKMEEAYNRFQTQQREK